MGYFFYVANIQASDLWSRIEFRKTQRVSYVLYLNEKTFSLLLRYNREFEWLLFAL